MSVPASITPSPFVLPKQPPSVPTTPCKSALSNLFLATRDGVRELTAPKIEVVPSKCKHGLPVRQPNWCAVCIRQTQSSKSKTYLNARRFSFQYTPVDVKGFDEIEEVVDFLAEEEKANGEAAERKFVSLPIEKWVDKRHENFLSLFGKLLEGGRSIEVRDWKYDVAWGSRGWKQVSGINASEQVVLRDGLSKPLTNWCPPIYEKDGVKKVSDGMYVQQNGKPREVADSVEERRTRWKNNRQRKLHALRTEYEYSPEEFDREILTSRGGVMGDVVKRFHKDFSRKGNKYRIR